MFFLYLLLKFNYTVLKYKTIPLVVIAICYLHFFFKANIAPKLTKGYQKLIEHPSTILAFFVFPCSKKVSALKKCEMVLNFPLASERRVGWGGLLDWKKDDKKWKLSPFQIFTFKTAVPFNFNFAQSTVLS